MLFSFVFHLCVLFVDLMSCCFFFFFKQKTAYEMRISDWSSDVCSSDLRPVNSPTRSIDRYKGLKISACREKLAATSLPESSAPMISVSTSRKRAFAVESRNRDSD